MTAHDAGMTVLAVVALLGVGAAAMLAGRQRRARPDMDLWPWLIDEISVAVGDGHTPSVALLGVALHGPPPLRAAAGPAVDAWRATGDPVAGIDALQRAVGDARCDRICRALGAVEALDGDAGAALARLRALAVTDAGHARQGGRYVVSVRLAAWSALPPVVAVITGHLVGGVAVVAIAAAIGTWGARLAVEPASRVRVLA